MAILPNPPEADKSLHLPCEMRSLFLWGYARKLILGIPTCMPVVNFLACLDLEQNISFLDRH